MDINQKVINYYRHILELYNSLQTLSVYKAPNLEDYADQIHLLLYKVIENNRDYLLTDAFLCYMVTECFTYDSYPTHRRILYHLTTLCEAEELVIEDLCLFVEDFFPTELYRLGAIRHSLLYSFMDKAKEKFNDIEKTLYEKDKEFKPIVKQTIIDSNIPYDAFTVEETISMIIAIALFKQDPNIYNNADCLLNYNDFCDELELHGIMCDLDMSFSSRRKRVKKNLIIKYFLHKIDNNINNHKQPIK